MSRSDKQRESLIKQAINIKFQIDNSDLIETKQKAKFDRIFLEREFKKERKRLSDIIRQCNKKLNAAKEKAGI